jgi:uncharacterized protein
MEEMDFDPRPVFRATRVPTLCFFGATDSWTPVAPSVKSWRAARSDAEIVAVSDAEHDMTLPDGTVAREYQLRLVDWLSRV